MKLNKYTLGDLIELVTDINSNLEYGIDDVKGMTLSKEIIPTKANINPKELSKFIIVSPNDFIFNPRTHGKKIGFGFNDKNIKFLISWNNIAFRIKFDKLNVINPNYLWIWLKRDEWDRRAVFNSWGSSTEVFSWNELCDMTIELPDIEIQEKYVNIYLSIVENQKSYENGLKDLKLTCNIVLENLRKKYISEPIGKYIVEINKKNTNNLIKLTQGINVFLQFIPAKREAKDQESAKIVENGQFAFNKVVKCGGTRLPIALRQDETCVISNSYIVFDIKDKEKILPDYLMMWFSRSETHRRCGYNAWGSTRDVFSFEELCKLEFPIPNIDIQKNVVNIYNLYKMREKIGEQFKEKLTNICPFLIRGSIEERKEYNE